MNCELAVGSLPDFVILAGRQRNPESNDSGNAPLHHSIKVSLYHSATVSLYHCITASQHHSTTASQT